MSSILEILGLLFFLIIHELGHALAGSIVGKKIKFTISKNNNPATVVTGFNSKREYVFVASAGVILNLMSYQIISTMLDCNLFMYLFLCFGCGFGDIRKIYQIVQKKGEQEDDS